MTQTILITGATDGIGLEAAKKLTALGHHVLLHGRNPDKLAAVEKSLSATGHVESYVADLSSLSEVDALAEAISKKHDRLHVLINNAGVLKTSNPITLDGLDVRFVVNTFAPYQLMQKLLPLLGSSGRVVNLSSAAQAPINLKALNGDIQLGDDMSAYAQSKLAITLWSWQMANALKGRGPMIVSVNPGSLLATKMVKEGFGMDGKDINIGADILVRAALSDEFADAHGRYFDNDSGEFAAPHPDAMDSGKGEALIEAMESVINSRS